MSLRDNMANWLEYSQCVMKMHMACVKSGPLIPIPSLIIINKYHTHMQSRVGARGNKLLYIWGQHETWNVHNDGCIVLNCMPPLCKQIYKSTLFCINLIKLYLFHDFIYMYCNLLWIWFMRKLKTNTLFMCKKQVIAKHFVKIHVICKRKNVLVWYH